MVLGVFLYYADWLDIAGSSLSPMYWEENSLQRQSSFYLLDFGRKNNLVLTVL